MNWQSPTLRAGGGRQAGRCCPAVGHSLSHGVTGTIAAQSHRGILGTCLLREGTVQPGEPSAVWRYRSWGGCKKKICFFGKDFPPSFRFPCKQYFFPFPVLHIFGVLTLEFGYLSQSSGCLRSF